MSQVDKIPFRSATIYHSPVRLLSMIVLSIFLAELAVMVVLHFVFPLPFLGEAIIDASALVLMLSPVFYLFLFRPLLLHITERKRTEEALRESERQIRALSFQILTAQETERRSIARELHDELGHALTLVKLRLRSIERGLRDHGGTREDCEDLMGYVDTVIENVRRLSRDLSPTILHDLGLTAALRWLVDNFSRNFDGIVELDMTDIDRLFPEDARIMIYRVFQEAFTNIGKHAQAKKVSAVVRQSDGGISFFIEDDGKGFTRTQPPGSAGKGLGLAIMEERVRMLSGSLEIHSREGGGTRLTFSIPLREE
jgi:signal transduction histidine kinase